MLQTKTCSVTQAAVVEALQLRSPCSVYEDLPPPPPGTDGEARVNAVVFHPFTRVLFVLLGLAAILWLN